MTSRVVRDAVRPTAPQHVDPGPGENPAGVWMGLVALDRPAVHLGGPGIGEATVLGEVDQGVTQLLVAGEPEGHCTVLATLAGRRRGAGDANLPGADALTLLTAGSFPLSSRGLERLGGLGVRHDPRRSSSKLRLGRILLSAPWSRSHVRSEDTRWPSGIGAPAAGNRSASERRLVSEVSSSRRGPPARSHTALCPVLIGRLGHPPLPSRLDDDVPGHQPPRHCGEGRCDVVRCAQALGQGEVTVRAVCVS
jgi:hypothetical protein